MLLVDDLALSSWQSPTRRSPRARGGTRCSESAARESDSEAGRRRRSGGVSVTITVHDWIIRDRSQGIPTSEKTGPWVPTASAPRKTDNGSEFPPLPRPALVGTTRNRPDGPVRQWARRRDDRWRAAAAAAQPAYTEYYRSLKKARNTASSLKKAYFIY
jgi:hypothetical protein